MRNSNKKKIMLFLDLSGNSAVNFKRIFVRKPFLNWKKNPFDTKLSAEGTLVMIDIFYFT